MKCVIKFEHGLKLNGGYEAYEKNRIKANAFKGKLPVIAKIKWS
jgi:hypothetical protein